MYPVCPFGPIIGTYYTRRESKRGKFLEISAGATKCEQQVCAAEGNDGDTKEKSFTIPLTRSVPKRVT